MSKGQSLLLVFSRALQFFCILLKCTCFPAEVNTPHISVRGKFFLCHVPTPEPNSLEMTPLILVLHCGPLYSEDIALKGKKG